MKMQHVQHVNVILETRGSAAWLRQCGARQVDGANVAIAENGGGLIGIEGAVASILILAR